MKSKNTFLSFLRHAASLAGGILIANPDPRFQALGAVLGALGTGWGMNDEYKAENSGKALIGKSEIPLLAFFLIATALSAIFTGCASSPGGAPIDTVRVEKNATRIVKVAAIYALQTEPGAGAELQRIAAGVDTVFGRGSLTPEQLSAFLDELKVRPENRLLMAAALTEVYEIITDLTGAKLPDITHPVVVAALNGVKQGIAEALALQAAVQPAK